MCSASASPKLPAVSHPIARPQWQYRAFSISPRPLKKNKRQSSPTSDPEPQDAPAARKAPTDDVYDFSNLEAGILKAMERLTHNLSELRAGGRFNPNIIESLNVTLPKGGGTAKLRDLAQVVPRGRNITVVVGEEDVSLCHGFGYRQ